MPDISMIPQTTVRFLVPGIFILLLVLESLYPLRRLKRRRGSRYLVNAALTGLGFLTGVLVVRPSGLFGRVTVTRV